MRILINQETDAALLRWSPQAVSRLGKLTAVAAPGTR